MELSVGGLIFLVILVVYALSERNKQDDKIADLKRDVIEKENKIKLNGCKISLKLKQRT